MIVLLALLLLLLLLLLYDVHVFVKLWCAIPCCSARDTCHTSDACDTCHTCNACSIDACLACAGMQLQRLRVMTWQRRRCRGCACDGGDAPLLAALKKGCNCVALMIMIAAAPIN